MKRLLLGLVALVAAQLLTMEQGHAYSISVDCSINPSPHIGVPKDNADCVYAWTGSADLVTNGSWEATLRIFALNILLDKVETGRFAFINETSPHAVFIKCANTVGFYHVEMRGKGWKFVYYVPFNPQNPGFWDDVFLAVDAADPFVSIPVTCP